MTLSVKSAKEIVPRLGQVIYIAGAQWGDEGKGKLVDILSEKYDIVARCAGGANAGHTIFAEHGGERKKFIFHLLPSGAIREDKICVIGHGTVLHLPTLFEEMNELRDRGITLDGRLKISDRAHLIFDYHKSLDELQEKSKGDKKVGTTKRGIGPAYADKANRMGLRICDLLHFENFAEKLRANIKRYQELYGIKMDIEREINIYRDAAEELQPFIINTMEYIHGALKGGKTLLIEGAQGTHLDLDIGTYPYVTSSNTTVGGACTGLGIPPSCISSVVGIVKAYTTRVGSGPFPTELGDMEGNMLREAGGEYGATTGRPRRCGWLDATVIKNSIAANGINSVNMTKLDVLSNFQNIKIGARYRLDGEIIGYIPACLEDFERVEVEYIDMPGWEGDISKVSKFKDLPKNAQNYIKQTEELIGAPINFIGVGQNREQIIYR
jgi:adenylosuccinate synthase